MDVVKRVGFQVISLSEARAHEKKKYGQETHRALLIGKMESEIGVI